MPTLANINATWTEALDAAQLEHLRRLRALKCIIEARHAPPDPQRDLPEGLTLEVAVDSYGLVNYRGTLNEIPLMFDKAVDAVQALFSYVSRDARA